MAPRKLYAGAKLRETRSRLGLTQKDFAARLGVSLPYLNQMENKNIVNSCQFGRVTARRRLKRRGTLFSKRNQSVRLAKSL